ncbi:MAG: hypothetical protein SPD11_08200 [Sphaerochaetaceae bacterium]|nr:hypothetical protein [Sphaerochaetaceae bacterium]
MSFKEFTETRTYRAGFLCTIFSVCALACGLLLSGCVVTEDLGLNSTTGGTSRTDLVIMDFFSEVLEDMSAFMPSNSDETITDAAVKDFANNLSNADNTTDVTYRKIPTSENSAYEIDFTFKNLQQLFRDLGGGAEQTVLTVAQNGGNTTLRLNLSMDNYDQLTKIIPFLADPNFEVWGPVYNVGETEENYLEMMSYILSEDGPPAIQNSLITLRFKTPSAIKSQTNGRIIDSTTFEYSFPLIDFLLLANPLTFSVSW